MTDSITLRFCEGSSDKVYTARIVPQGDGFVVQYEYGRYGGSLKADTKTPAPVSLEQAQRIFGKLVQEKKAKGYTESAGGQAYLGTELAGRDTGLRVQLLNAIESEEELEAFILDDAWGLQEKWNGERRTLILESDAIIGGNRKGLAVAIAGELDLVCRDRLMPQLSGRTEIDGEDFGTTFAPFDLLMLNGRCLRAAPYEQRLALLDALIVHAPEFPKPHTYRTAAEKRAKIAELRAANFEGVVFKRMSAPYTPGKPNSGGDQRKFPFRASATFRVVGPNEGKRSVGLELLDPATSLWGFFGNVTILPNFAIPAVGAIVEVNYAWANVGGSIQQPVYCGIRRDLDASDCLTTQLKFKAEPKHSQAA